MTDQEKLNVLNSIEVADYSASDGELESVYVINSEENREKLRTLGASDQIITSLSDEDDIEIVSLAFEFTIAVWFDGNRFLSEIPLSEDE